LAAAPHALRPDIRQGNIYDVGDSLWIVLDNFPNDIPTFPGLHCAPVLSEDECPALDLDVRITRAGGIASLGLIRKINKTALTKIVTDATPSELRALRTNLITWFAVFSYETDLVATLPALGEEHPGLLPGMIINFSKGLVCVVDHWSCYNEYPLVYVAPVVADLEDATLLDVDVTHDYRDLFGERFYVRTHEFFQVEREDLTNTLAPDRPIPMLRYGATRRVTRSFALKVGELALLL
jgi:hypothetical protein